MPEVGGSEDLLVGLIAALRSEVNRRIDAAIAALVRVPVGIPDAHSPLRGGPGPAAQAESSASPPGEAEASGQRLNALARRLEIRLRAAGERSNPPGA